MLAYIGVPILIIELIWMYLQIPKESEDIKEARKRYGKSSR